MFILKHARVSLVLNIVDRRNVFESVLQSTIVDMFQKNRKQACVRVKNIETMEDLANSNEVQVAPADFLFGEPVPIFLVAANPITYGIFRKVKFLPTFSKVGISFTTGKIQWDLYKDALSGRQTSKATRLIWAENIQRYRFGENKNRGDKLFIHGALRSCSPIKTGTIVVQRTTAVEQEWRIIATTIYPREFGLPIQCENHTSYLELMPANIQIEYILALLNSRLMDFIFRHTNSNTQVSAGELNSLPFPKRNRTCEDEITTFVSRILAAKKADPAADTSALEREIDRLVYQLYGLTPEEIAVVEGGGSHE